MQKTKCLSSKNLLKPNEPNEEDLFFSLRQTLLSASLM